MKSLALPPGYSAPRALAFEDLRARALSRADLHDDVTGINASLELIRRTRGGGWPTDAVSTDYDFVDLVWHECEFREGYSFAYAVYDRAGRYVGCFYLYPMGRRTPITEAVAHHDVDASWWVTTEAYGRGLYATLHRAMQHWLATSFPFTTPYYSNVAK